MNSLQENQIRMQNKLFLLVLLYLVSPSLWGQNDSIRKQILGYEESRSTVISKARKMITDKFLAGDFKKIKEVKDYIVQTNDSAYINFYPKEYWFLLYWTQEYTVLAEDIIKLDSLYVVNFRNKITPDRDILNDVLSFKSHENQTQLKMQIKNALLDNETRDFLLLTFDYLIWDENDDRFVQDELNDRADHFMLKYPKSKCNDFIRRIIKYKLVPKDWGMSFEFFSGYGIFTKSLASNYTNNIPIGVAFDICYKKYELQLRDYIGFNKTKSELKYSQGTLKKNTRITVFLPEASISYVMYSNNLLQISPFVGIASMDISLPTAETQKVPALKELSLEFTTTYAFGINYTFKLKKNNGSKYHPNASFTFMRIRYGYCMPQFQKKYEGISGNMHFITIGFGAMARALKRVR